MARFTGTDAADQILRDSLSLGVTSDPSAAGTLTGESNDIFGGGGADRIEAGDNGDTIHGGAGNDWITGGTGDDWLYGDAGADRLVSGDTTSFRFVVLDGGAGGDTMIGGAGYQVFVVDSYQDIVVDRGNDGTSSESFDGDTIATTLDYKLAENAGIDVLDFSTSYLGVAERASNGTGNSHDNYLIGSAFRNVLNGGGGNDYVSGGGGNDLSLGGRGNDDTQGNDGDDIVRGQDGNDGVWGGAGRDTLVGGRGGDTFFFNYADESVGGARDVIAAGDGSTAFEGAGAAAGDLLWLPNAPSADSPPQDYFFYDFGAFVFGGTGKGHVSCIDNGRDTLVRANTDDDAGFEFQCLIRDGAVRASAYTADDFFLG